MDKISTFLVKKEEQRILTASFEGEQSSLLACQSCPFSSEKVEGFLSIRLDIKDKKTLEQALDGYVDGQILDGENAYLC
jgi:ubiquitin C-terminal hydrolase